ncbi:bifunctional enoyl-CoA hydratase/phosphate acetyltransferase [Candidatus Fermentibacteria bacterium]|nr:bifunctional enoyl-CoA hydratase/phosphate acetyltransferase [Candidatus Fermentibacteria bacterium]
MEPIRNLEQLKERAKELPSMKVAVVMANESETLSAVSEAVEANMLEAVLIGPEEEIASSAEEAGVDISGMEIVHVTEEAEAAMKGTQLVRNGRAQVLMKGLIATSTFLKAVLDRESGIRGEGLLSHVAVIDAPEYHKLLLITDAAMNIDPDFEQKMEMLKNAVTVAHAIGIEKPKATYICAKEKPYQKMPRTMEAARMKEAAGRGELGEVIFDAPLAMDLAVSAVAKKIKKIDSPVAGDADLLLLPDIESGNAIYKTLIFLAGAELGAVIMGATHPVVLTSRADSAESKLCSIVLAGVVASYMEGN